MLSVFHFVVQILATGKISQVNVVMVDFPFDLQQRPQHQVKRWSARIKPSEF